MKATKNKGIAMPARWLIAMCILMLPVTVSAEPISLAKVVHEALSNHPDLPIGRIGISMAEAEKERIDGALDPRVAASLGYSDEKSPTTSPFAANQTQSGNFYGMVTQPLQDGSTLTGSLNYNRTKLNYPLSVPTTFQSTINPIYSHQIDLTYRYPLLRGHGNPAYHEMLDAAEKDTDSARWRVDIIKEGLAAQAIALYFQLAMNELSLKIASDAIARSERLLRYQKYREQFGLIEKADRLQAEALLATRRMEKNSAETEAAQAQTALNRLMMREGSAALSPSTDETVIPTSELAAMNVESLLETAHSNRPIFKSLAAKLDAADARLKVARDQHDTQVDLVGQIGSRALDANAGKALGQGFNLKDRFVSVSVELSDTLGGKATHAAIRQAELARQQAVLEEIQAAEAIKSDLSAALSQLQTESKTLEAARARAAAEKRKFAAEMKRYREGRSNTAAIIQFEGDLRIAELQVALHQTTMQMATHQLMLARGTLFDHLFNDEHPGNLEAGKATSGEAEL